MIKYIGINMIFTYSIYRYHNYHLESHAINK